MKLVNLCGPRVREARIQLSWDQVELSVAIFAQSNVKIEQSDISEIERQARGVRDFELKALALALDVSVGWLLGD